MSTGIRATSGDMDIAVNQEEVDKGELYNKLAAWAQQNHPDDDVRQWVSKVRYKCSPSKLQLMAIMSKDMYKQT